MEAEVYPAARCLPPLMPYLTVLMPVLVQMSSKHQAEAPMKQHPTKLELEVSAECSPPLMLHLFPVAMEANVYPPRC